MFSQARAPLIKSIDLHERLLIDLRLITPDHTAFRPSLLIEVPFSHEVVSRYLISLDDGTYLARHYP